MPLLFHRWWNGLSVVLMERTGLSMLVVLMLVFPFSVEVETPGTRATKKRLLDRMIRKGA
jgi:hypothetical protein